MKKKPKEPMKKKKWTLYDAHDQYMLSSRLLTVMEHNGVKINVKRLQRTKRIVDRRIKKKEEKLRKSKVYKLWRNKYGTKTNLNSHQQLGDIFYNVLKYKSRYITATGKFKTNEEEMAKLDHPFLQLYFDIAKYKKLKGTNIANIEREITDKGFIHPNFNQHLVISHRTSCDSPNWQNQPIRNPVTGKLIRDLVVSRFKNGRIVERDYSGLEVATMCFYHEDPVMIKYLQDGFDFHKDTSAQIFMCDVEDISKSLRFEVKNKFTFAQFYGDYHKQIAPKLWDAVISQKCEIRGMPVLEWLKKKGIKRLGKCKHGESPESGTFEKQVQKIEEDFWNRRFKVYSEWKKRVWAQYLKTGQVNYIHGFINVANLRKNQVLNIANQGFASHCLIWSFSEIQREIEKSKMRTKLIAQIHDSGISDTPDSELQDFLNTSDEIVVKGLKKHFTFMNKLNVPLSTEVEVTPKGGSWYEKEQWVKNKKGIWCPKPKD